MCKKHNNFIKFLFFFGIWGQRILVLFLTHFREGNDYKVFGAGLLSSAAELEHTMQGIQVKFIHNSFNLSKV